jgi:hypothetical protein
MAPGLEPSGPKEQIMEDSLRTLMDNLWSEDHALQNAAFGRMLELTDKPVDWAYEIWDELVKNLSHRDNHNRAIAAQVLCNLARSDPENRMLKDFGALLDVTRDERFVTARHCMQSLWKVGVVGNGQQERWLQGLAGRFEDCAAEKNCTLIRYDILQSFRNVYDTVHVEPIRAKALELIETEPDPKYRKKYATLWKK